ncbi:hypothetical protein U9M48_033735 [Paspalum notatum var. saurae]|uniref:Uncharacterized protein n=1 Tax=Paspalum notatum var. saurae TaxID=547442 RepID=A0AAQ3U907_PASNO
MDHLAPVVAILLCLCFFVRAHCDSASDSASSEQEQEIQMLRSKVASLEDEISTRKEETSQLESIVRERTAQLAAVVGELELLQVTQDCQAVVVEAMVNVDDESVMKANTHNAMLEKQIERLGSDLEDQVRKGESLESRATEAERGLHELGGKLARAEKTNIEQRKKIQDLSNRVRHSQDKLSELEKEAKLKAEELAKESKRFTQPYISHAVAASEPHLSRASVILEPYMRPATSAWRRLVSSTSGYHRLISMNSAHVPMPNAMHMQVQNGVRRFALEGNQLLTPPSADKLAWIAVSSPVAYVISVARVRRGSEETHWCAEHSQASALFAMPLLSMYKVFSAMNRFRKIQAKKDTAGSSRKNRRRADK